MKRAAAMMLTGRPIGAREALRVGFVSDVAADGGELAAAPARAGRIAECSPAAIGAIKQVMNELADMPPAEAFEAQDALSSVRDMRASPDAVEGPRTFVGKRPPRWHGG